MAWITWILENYQTVVTSLIAVLTALITLSLLIPGDQPEKFLQSVLDVLTKFSKK